MRRSELGSLGDGRPSGERPGAGERQRPGRTAGSDEQRLPVQARVVLERQRQKLDQVAVRVLCLMILEAAARWAERRAAAHFSRRARDRRRRPGGALPGHLPRHPAALLARAPRSHARARRVPALPRVAAGTGGLTPYSCGRRSTMSRRRAGLRVEPERASRTSKFEAPRPKSRSNRRAHATTCRPSEPNLNADRLIEEPRDSALVTRRDPLRADPKRARSR